jgi:hypothetical protein
MKKFGHFCTNFILLVIAMVFLDSSKILAQRASAEYISSILPTSLETGQEVKDGIQNVTYYDNILYVVNIWAGIQVVDVSTRETPKEIGKYLNDHRAHNFYIDGDYGYLSDELEGVHIIDVSNPSVLTRVGKITTKGNAFWVVAKNPYVYVAEEEMGVSIYDITNPASPVALGNFDTPGWAWEMIIRDDILYIADKTGGLQILNVSDKNNPIRLGQFNGPKNARAISLDENHIYMADGAECVCIIDVTNPKFPTLVNKMSVDGYIPDIFKSGKNLFMANETKKSMEIVDVSSLPEMIPGGSYQAEDKIYGLWKEDVYVFVAANSKTLVLRYNSPPTIEAFPDTVINEQEIITITARAFDPDGDILSYEIDNMPEGAVFDSLSGILSWTPTYEQSGDYTNITIRVIEFTDSRLTDEESFKIAVNHVNRPPSLPEVDDQMVNENQVITVEIAEGTDEDKEDTGRLVYTVENLPEGATFDAQKRILTWIPSFEQSGTYVLDFVLSDQAGGVDRDASTITVVHVDRKPVIQVVENKTVNENEALEFIVQGDDLDKEDQNAISFSAMGLPEGAIFDVAGHKFSWTPGYDNSGVYENLTFVMRAGNLSDSSSINITVNHVNRAPVMNDIANKTVDENKKLTFTIGGADSDSEDEGKLVFTATQLPEGAVFNADSMQFTWTPTYEQSGTFENVTFTIQDPTGLSHSATMSITVNHVNRPPVLADVPPQAVEENTPLAINLQGNDPDSEDQNSLQYSANQLPEGATLEGSSLSWTPTYEQSGEYTIQLSLSDGKLSDSKSVVLTVNHVNRPPSLEPIEPKMIDENKPIEFKIIANDPDKEDAGKYTLSAVQLPQGAVFTPETATFTWTPTFEQAGAYTITFNNTDAQGLVTSQTVELTVNHVNRTPVLAPITAQTTEENVPLSVVIPAGEDPDTEDIQKLVYSTENLPEGATFDPATRTLTWTPGYDQSGNYEIPISLTDGEFTVTQNFSITITHVNRPATMEDIPTQTVEENQPLTIKAQFSDPDTEDDGKLQLTASNLPEGAIFNAATGEISWTPTYDQAGSFTNISISVKDPIGLGVDKTFTITVNNVNRPPELNPVEQQNVAENATLSVSIQGTDPDKEDEGKLQYSGDNLPQGAALDPTSGALSWTPGFTQAGSYQISVKLTDAGGLTAELTVPVEVTDVNRPPQLQSVPAQTVDEGATLSFSLSATDEDTDNQLAYSINNLSGGATLDESSGQFSWTPGFDQAGNYTLSANVSDGTAESSTTITVTVNDINRAPTIDGGGSVTITAGETATLGFSGSDPDGDNLTFESSDLPAGANLISGNGNFSWTPTDDQTGNFTFTVRVSDGKESAETTGRVTVNPKPAPAPETPPAETPPAETTPPQE